MPRSSHAHGVGSGPTRPIDHGHRSGSVGAAGARTSERASTTTTIAEAPCRSVVAFDADACALVGAAIAAVAVVLAVAELRSRRRWRGVARTRREVGGAYRATTVVTAYRSGAPASVRVVAALALLGSALGASSLVLVWRAFHRHGMLLVTAALAMSGVAYGALALLERASGASEVARSAGTVALLVFVPALAVGVVDLFAGAGCVAAVWPSVSVDALAVVVATVFVAIAAALMRVASRADAEAASPSVVGPRVGPQA